MKKLFFFLLLALSSGLSFTACTEENEEVKPKVENQQQTDGNDDILADPY